MPIDMKTTIKDNRPIASMCAQFLITCVDQTELKSDQAESMSPVVYAAMMTAISNVLLIQAGDRMGSPLHTRALAELVAECQFCEAQARAMVAQTNAAYEAKLAARGRAH